MQNDERKIQILVIEDNPADVDLLRRAFRSAQLECELILLEDGAEALAYVRRLDASLGAAAPDLAVLDLNLPKNDGIEVLQAMRASSVFARVPVAILSSSASSRERARIAQYGIGRYITKPPDLDEFLRIGVVLKELVAAGGTAHR
jgi:two-component system, chemotaxis family, response regulator Rcp1